MTDTNFDAAGYINIDLEAGAMTSIADERLTAVPATILAHLPSSQALEDEAFAWGQRHGVHFSKGTGGAPASQGMEVLANQLGGTLSVFGIGSLTIELRGDALLFNLSGSLADGPRLLVSGFLAGFLRCISPHTFEVVGLGAEDGSELFWAGNPQAAQRLTALTGQGHKPSAALATLTGGTK